MNLSWLVGTGKPEMPLPCSDATVFAMHDGFYKKNVVLKFAKRKKHLIH